jgi:HAD superfamily phosphatase (TIGR01668 family)
MSIKPSEFYGSVFDVDYDGLYGRGIMSVIFDIDNTLQPYDVAEPGARVSDLISRLSGRFGVCLLSNNSRERVAAFSVSLGVPAVFRAGKPFMRAADKALTALGRPAANSVCLIGDQLFTDMWLGARAGFYTILVKPLCCRDEFAVRIKRLPEKILLKKYGLPCGK